MQITINDAPGAEPGGILRGYRYFWLKKVIVFTPVVHCARCLVGDYVKPIRAGMRLGQCVEVAAAPGAIYYLCGVAFPYRWADNAHLALAVDPAASAELQLSDGQSVVVVGARRLDFDDRAARARFPDRGRAYLTCRNFQFGAQHFAG